MENQTLKNLHDISDTLRAYADWFDQYAKWWEAKYGGKTAAQMEAMVNGSTPPPPPPRVPPE